LVRGRKRTRSEWPDLYQTLKAERGHDRSQGASPARHQMLRGADASGAVRREGLGLTLRRVMRRTPMPVGPISGVVRRQLDLLNRAITNHAK
jgi:hypothetical protein